MKELVLLLSTSCNANCSFCTQNHLGNDMTIERFKEILFQNPSLSSLELFGGEPLINFKVIKNIFDNKTDKELIDRLSGIENIKITTNGLLLTQEIYEFFVNLNKKIKTTIVISYDGIFQNQRGYQLPTRVKDIIKNDAGTNKLIRISFGVYNHPDKLLDQYLGIKEEFSLTPNNIDFYFNRNYYEYPNDIITKFMFGFMKFLIYLDTFRLPLPNRLKEYHMRILGDIGPSRGCGAGIDRFAFTPTSKLNCGVINNSENIDLPTEVEFNQMCSGCSIINQCPRKCPAMLKHAYDNNLNQDNILCDIHKIIVSSIKKYYTKE